MESKEMVVVEEGEENEEVGKELMVVMIGVIVGVVDEVAED